MKKIIKNQSLLEVFNQILKACETIASELKKPKISRKQTISENSSGETQKFEDIVANNILKQRLLECKEVAFLSSEEEDNVLECNAEGEYIVSFDPLDGSSNLDMNISVGTIFSILKKQKNKSSKDQFMQKGKHQIASGYVLYGPQLTAVIAINKPQNSLQSHVHQLHYSTDEWLISREHLAIPNTSNEFAINSGNYSFWSEEIKLYINQCMRIFNSNKEKMSQRWVGSMVADINRIVCRGGVFLYPYSHVEGYQKGKLRLLYEASPMALIIEQAGGLAIDDKESILDIQPTSIHQTVGVILGSKEEIKKIQQINVESNDIV